MRLVSVSFRGTNLTREEIRSVRWLGTVSSLEIQDCDLSDDHRAAVAEHHRRRG